MLAVRPEVGQGGVEAAGGTALPGANRQLRDAEQDQRKLHPVLVAEQSHVISSTQASPSAKTSFLKIGTSALSVSISQWQASSAAARWGAATTTDTLTS